MMTLTERALVLRFARLGSRTGHSFVQLLQGAFFAFAVSFGSTLLSKSGPAQFNTNEAMKGMSAQS